MRSRVESYIILIVPHEEPVTNAKIAEITNVNAGYAPVATLSSNAELI